MTECRRRFIQRVAERISPHRTPVYDANRQSLDPVPVFLFDFIRKATVSVHPLDLDAIGAEAGDVLTVESRRGRVSLFARADDGIARGSVFIPFCYYEAAANMLTNQALDPFAKIAEVKYCAVRVVKGGVVSPQLGYHGEPCVA